MSQRQRLSWDAEKVASIEKKADPYTMNQTRQNPPVEKYETGNPDAWAETPNMGTPWKTEGRNEVGLPAPAAQQAVMAARKMEDKAYKCLTVAQRMLPGASDSAIEEQATDLMFLPERAVLATLQRQTELAEKLAGGKGEGEEDDDKPAPAAEEPVEAKKEEEKKPEEAAPGAAPAPAAPAAPAPVVEAKKDEKAPETTPAPEKKPEDAPAPAAAPEAVEAAANSEDFELGKQGSDLLDQLFQDVTASEPKQGAKTLSGMVKQASTSSQQLDSLWELPPDVSATFKR